MRRVLTATALAVLAAQVGPAATWLPGVRRRLLPRLAGTGAPGSVALTFDDGPHATGTPAILDALDDLGWPATFFVLGEQARRYPDVVRETMRRGHEIALHGDVHRSPIARSPRAVALDLRRAHDTVADIVGRAPTWWRPPYGVLSGPALLAAHSMDLKPLLWSAWGRDWRVDATSTSVVHHLCRGGLDGATVLLHDSDITSAPASWRTTRDALPLLAEALAMADIKVRPLGEHLAR